MTDRQMALAIAQVFRRLQATQTAYQVYLNRLPIDVQSAEQLIDWGATQDLSAQSPFGLALDSFALELESANPHEVLALLYRELLEPH
jgi:hypothetical protein